MGLPEIKILHIAHNRALRGLASNLLKPMPSLQEFDATGCAIRTVPAAFFDNSRMLKRLKLNDNNIDTLPHELFRSLLLLEEVFLAGKAVSDRIERWKTLSSQVTSSLAISDWLGSVLG